jgi:hypothetical protein
VAKVPVTLAGKQGRCAGCRKVIEVPDVPPTGGRTPDPEEGLLDVGRRSDLDRVSSRPSDRVPARTSGRKSARTSARRSAREPQVPLD